MPSIGQDNNFFWHPRKAVQKDLAQAERRPQIAFGLGEQDRAGYKIFRRDDRCIVHVGVHEFY